MSWPTPGGARELAAFEKLQARLPKLFRKVFSDPLAPRTVLAVPALTMDHEVLARVVGGQHYEERQLTMLMLLRLPNTRIIYVSSMPIEPTIIDYYLNQLPGVPGRHARQRLTLLSASDSSPVTLTRKILDRPRLLAKIRDAIGDPALAHMSCFNVTECERTLAVRLGIPLYGCDPQLLYLGTKSGSRKAFREAGIDLPDGHEDLRDPDDIAESLAVLKQRSPDLSRAVVKLNDGFSGEMNAVFSYTGCPGGNPTAWIKAHLPLNLAFEARDMRWEKYVEKLTEMGGIVEEWIPGSGLRSPSVQMRVTPIGKLEMISTHDQILGGPSGQIFQGSTFPADAAYAKEIQALSSKAGKVFQRKGVLGRFGVDFVSVKRNNRWKHFAIEVNLRKGGTTHTYQTLQLLTNGKYDPRKAEFHTPTGQLRAYYATDNLINPLYRRLTPDDLIDISVQHGIHFDQTSQQGVVFSVIGALPRYGKLGVIAIAQDTVKARAMFNRAVDTLDAEAAKD